MSDIKIVPLDAGNVYFNKSFVIPRRDLDVEIPGISFIWYIQGAEKKILVDTSFRSVVEVSKVHPTYKLNREPHQEIEFVLSKVGVKPEEIDIVILTHLHWDHCQNNAIFKNATFIVQREEIRYAVAPLPTHAVTYETPIIGMKPYWLEIPRFELVEGDAEIVKDVSVIHTPSQTPGYQSVVVNTTAGTQVIAGCMVPLYENWGSSRLGTHIVGLDPFSLDAYWKSFQKIESLADVVFPGHDPEVLRRHGNGI